MANPEVTVAVNDTNDMANIVNESEQKANRTSVVENSEEQAERNPNLNSETKTEKYSQLEIEEGSSTRKWSSIEESHHDPGASLLHKWKKIFLTSCVFAVLLDPLFLYIPIINHDMNCVGLDRNLKLVTLTLRSVTDLFYTMDIIVQFYRSESCSGLISRFRNTHRSRAKFLWNTFLPAIAKTIWQSYILIDILAILPLPQVLIPIFFSRMRASRSLNTWKLIMNFFILMQYVPRVCRIYLLSKEPKRSIKGETAIWVKGVLNFFMYILASHVLGAVWYFFAIQQMTVCWEYACPSRKGCETGTFGCHGGTVVNITFQNDFCSINSSNTTGFDFGIYLSVLQSGIPTSANFLQKFSNCFCWGMRNLSSLGSNLQPSTNTWENFFVAFISIIGLLLFIYLIGNLQTYMQLDTARIEERRHKVKMERKMEEKDREIGLWLAKNGIPKRSRSDIKEQMMKKVQQELEENRGADLDKNILPILPSELENYIKSCMPLTRLKQVPVLQNMDEQGLKAILDHLKPKKYSKNDMIIREDEPLEMMLFIVDGLVLIEKKDSSINFRRGATEMYGEKLLNWPSWTFFPDVLPKAVDSVRAIGDVEVLVLMATDMVIIGSKFSSHFREYFKLNGQLANHLEQYGIAARTFTAEELNKATNNYHVSRLLGEGYASVHKGILSDETTVAVKKYGLWGRHHHLVNEVIVHSQIKHKHVVRFIGYCLETEAPLLVLEYISNGNLYDHIHKRSKGPTLSLELRMRIASETAGALAYLHSSISMPLIIHRDVKSANILLDNNYTAKLSDFGLSRCWGPEDHNKTHVTTGVAGTFGYVAPEYAMTCRVSEKSDVYSFGVVLAELLTSRKALLDKPSEWISLADCLCCSVKEGRLAQILDHEIVNVRNFETAEKVAHLASRCLCSEPEERPFMKEVATELEGLMGIICFAERN